MRIISVFVIVFFLVSCSRDKLEEKGFSVNSIVDNTNSDNLDGISKDSLKFETKPSNVLLTGLTNYRITTIYKVNYNKKNKYSFIGSNYFHSNYSELGNTNGNRWNYNYVPGLEAVYGYNMVNISHYNILENKKVLFFDKPVLIKTLYYPSFSKDTLNFEPVNRDYFMVSVYDEDTNKDGYINVKDLRRFYLFDVNGENKQLLIPKNYSIIKSEYDSANDFMYVFAQLDEDENGKKDDGEDLHIYWIDLKDPNKTGRLY
ncbi:MAG: hypothetical protein COA31_008055 [Flavobacteriales bacterium]|nr:hypothetical protein [Flavobacteriales bacterium]|tara:strand:+ start:20892 stop:21668 length:777 start_codon:yes stop_codon:yes gene_type:complete